MSWSIKPQIKSERGVETEVDIKEIRFAPITDKKTGQLGFMPLANVVIQLLYKHEKQPGHWKLTKSKHGYNFTCPTRFIPASDSPTETKMVEVPGRAFGGRPTSGSMNFRKATDALTEQVRDNNLVTTIMMLFLAMEAEIVERRAAAGEKKAKKKKKVAVA